MSFPWCGHCANCEQDMRSYCVHAFGLKMKGTRADGSTLLSKNGGPVYSAFFQQSSFGTFALTQERYAVKVRKDAPLELLGPLACSGQTGAGAVLNVMKPKAGDSFAVFGVGAVGLSALMAAKIAGCDPIIAVDVHERRLALAGELGATHTINHATCSDVVGEIRNITGRGVRYSLETSALPAVFREAIESLMPAGTCVLLGSIIMPIDISTDATTRSMMRNGKNSRKPISKARLSSEIMKAGNQDAHRHIFRLVRHLLARHIHEQLQIFLADVFLHEAAQRHAGPVECLVDADFVVHQRLDADVVDVGQNRPHHECGEEQRKRDDDGIRRRRRRAERGAQKRQHDDDPRERRHHDENGRRQRQHRQKRDQLNDALVQSAATAGALAEIDADILRGERCRREQKSRYRGRPGYKPNAAAPWCEHQVLVGRPSKLAISCSRLS